MTKQRRAMIVTFLGAGIGAIFAEHLLKPGLKRRLRIR